MEIVRTKTFDKDVKRLRLTSLDLEALFALLGENPLAGDKIEGLRGVRKIRFGIPSRKIGKRGGGRAMYLVWEQDDVLVLLMAYGKNEKADLSDTDRKVIAGVLGQLLESDDG